MSTNGSKTSNSLHENPLPLEVLHAEKRNDNAFLGRPKTRAVPTKLAPSVRPSIHPSTHSFIHLL